MQEDHDTSSESEGDFSELPQITVKKEPTANKETSKISIADFYSGQDVYSDEGLSGLVFLISYRLIRTSLPKCKIDFVKLNCYSFLLKIKSINNWF